MARDKRRAAATATVGYGLVAGGSAVNAEGVQRARRALHDGGPSLPARAVWRARNRKASALYLGGNAIRLVGAPAAAVGTVDVFRHRQVTKAYRRDDPDYGFLVEGVRGTGAAVHQKVRGATEGTPVSHAAAATWGLGAGGATSLAAHRTLDRYRPHVRPRGRAAITGVAGVAGTVASLPLANRIARGHGYEMTATGVKRTKRGPVRPSKAARVVDGRRMGRSDFRRQTVGKALTDEQFARKYGADPSFPDRPETAGNRAQQAHARAADARSTERTVVRRKTYPRRPDAGPDRVARQRRRRTETQRRLRTEEFLTTSEGRAFARRGSLGRRGKVLWGPDAPKDKMPAGWYARRGWGNQQLPRPNAGYAGTGAPYAYRRRAQVAKSDYAGRHTSPAKQRATTMAAGAIPFVPFAGPAAAARTAMHYAPPTKSERRKAAGRQLSSSASSSAAGVGAAYGGAHLAATRPGAHRAANAIYQAPGRAKAALLGRPHVPKAAETPKALARFAHTRALKPLVGSPERMVGAAAGYLAGRTLVGQAAQQTAISRNLAAQRRYNAAHPVAKSQLVPTKREQYRSARRRHRNAALGTVANVAGLTGATLLAAREIGPKVPRIAGWVTPRREHLERAGVGTALAGGGIGGAVGLSNSRAERRRAKAETRQLAVHKAASVWHEFTKADPPLHTYMDEKDAHKTIRRYGAAGPIDAKVDRETRMRIHEARYVHSGGHKGERWQHRAQTADKVKTAGLAGATAAGAGYLARHPHKIRGFEGAAIASGTVGGAAELYAAHARRRRAQYASTPGGIAGAALRRMRAYDAAQS